MAPGISMWLRLDVMVSEYLVGKPDELGRLDSYCDVKVKVLVLPACSFSLASCV